MRQLVSVVTEQQIAYYVTDEHGDDVQQIATVINPGLQTSDVITLGANLTDALRLNGKRPKVVEAIAASVPTPEPEPEPKQLTVKGTPRQRQASSSPRRKWGLTMDIVLADVIEHSGATTPEIAKRLLGDIGQPAQQAVNNTLHRLRQAGEVRYGEREGVTTAGNRWTRRTVTAVL